MQLDSPVVLTYVGIFLHERICDADDADTLRDFELK